MSPDTVRAGPPTGRHRQRGVVSLEFAAAAVVLMGVLAGAVGITNLMHDREQSAVAAYAAGRALALRATAPATDDEMIEIACRAAKRATGVQGSDDTLCAGRWGIDVTWFASAADLRSGTPGSSTTPGGDDGDVIRVVFTRPVAGWMQTLGVHAGASASTDEDFDGTPDSQDADYRLGLKTVVVLRNDREKIEEASG